MEWPDNTGKHQVPVPEREVGPTSAQAKTNSVKNIPYEWIVATVGRRPGVLSRAPQLESLNGPCQITLDPTLLKHTQSLVLFFPPLCRWETANHTSLPLPTAFPLVKSEAAFQPPSAGNSSPRLPCSDPIIHPSGEFSYQQVETGSSLLAGRCFADSRGSLFDLESPSEVGYSSDCQT